MAKELGDLQKLLSRSVKVIPTKVPRIVEVEGLKNISENFKAQGFHTGSGVRKWQGRKKKDDRGRDITRYRTNRVGRRGSLNRYGSKIKDRALLVGHNTGGDKLKNSFKARRGKYYVKFYTYKPYAQAHNEGEGDMPQRQFMGKSKHLEKSIHKKLTKELDKFFKK